jgi:uncharacterized protein (DUF433 family)
MNRTVVIVEPGRADVRRRRNTACDRELRIPAAATSAIPNFDTIRSGGFVLGFSTRPPYPRRMTFDRITVDPDLMGGVPTIRGLRIPVATVVSMVADGMTVDEICADLPDLSAADITEALRYAAETVRERRLPLRPSA